MEALALIISIIALVLSALAYQKAGGTMDLRDRVDTLGSVTDSFRSKTADVLDKLEKIVRKEEKSEKSENEE